MYFSFITPVANQSVFLIHYPVMIYLFIYWFRPINHLRRLLSPERQGVSALVAYLMSLRNRSSYDAGASSASVFAQPASSLSASSLHVQHHLTSGAFSHDSCNAIAVSWPTWWSSTCGSLGLAKLGQLQRLLPRPCFGSKRSNSCSSSDHPGQDMAHPLFDHVSSRSAA